MKKFSKMSKGALPVPYIVAIIIAIIVIALLVVWFFILRGQGGSAATLAFCQGKAITFCTQVAACGYQNSCAPKDKDGNAITDFYVYAPDCVSFRGQPSGLPNSIQATPNSCNPFLGQSTT